jgi:hypothetical protein
MNDHNGRYARLRYTAMGALAALAATGAVLGATALAAKRHPETHAQARVANATRKTPTAPVPGESRKPPAGNPQPFLDAIQQLVDNATITAAEGQAVDHEIQAGSVDPGRLAASGLNQSQLQAVQHALEAAKLAQAQAPQPAAESQPFLHAIQQLVDNATITAAEGQAVDHEIQAGRVDSDTLASSGLTQTQLQAVQQALSDTKRGLGSATR